MTRSRNLRWWAGAISLGCACALGKGVLERPQLDVLESLDVPADREHEGAATTAVVAAPLRIAPPAAAASGEVASGRTSATAPWSAEQPDPGWLRLPRNEDDLVLRLVVSPGAATADLVLRSKTFNPGDAWLPLHCRVAVGTVIASMRPEVEAMTRAFEMAVERDFGVAQARALAVPLDFSRVEGRLYFAQLGHEPFCRQVDGVNYGVRRRDMPDACAAQQNLRRIGSELVMRLAAAFHDGGGLTAEQQQDIEGRAQRCAAGG